MEAVEEVRIQHEITENAFFHDFLLFLQEAGRDPFRLTERGNLRLGEIHYFGEHFQQDIYHRHVSGEQWYVRSETDVPPLRRIHLLTQHMRLTETRKHKLLLSIRGKAYLAHTSPKKQFEQLILWYLKRYDWTAWYSHYAQIAATLQWSQSFLWRYLLARKGTKIDFSRFLSGVRDYFGLDALRNEPYFSSSVRWAVEQMLVKDLRLFGLLSVDSVKWGNFVTDETIHSFQISALGAHIFELALKQHDEGKL